MKWLKRFKKKELTFEEKRQEILKRVGMPGKHELSEREFDILWGHRKAWEDDGT